MKRLLGLTLLTAALLISAPTTFSENPLNDAKIVVDAGHGGSDPGSTECAGLYESSANLDIALRLQGLLQANGAIVYMTRTGDTYLTNRDRYTYANSTDADALVSIHLNGSEDHSLNYTQGLFAKMNKDIEITQVVHDALAARLGIPDHGIMQFASGVILKANMPATLQEAVFISNSTECGLLTDATGNRQQEIAEAYMQGWSNGSARPRMQMIPQHPGGPGSIHIQGDLGHSRSP